MAWLDPRWFTFEALNAEWQRKDIRGWFFSVATASLVLILVLHPETAPTALYIDSVGLEMFLTLLELQVAVGLVLYREQLVTIFRAISASDNLPGTALRKAVALPRYSWAALNGAFR